MTVTTVNNVAPRSIGARTRGGTASSSSANTPNVMTHDVDDFDNIDGAKDVDESDWHRRPTRKRERMRRERC